MIGKITAVTLAVAAMLSMPAQGANVQKKILSFSELVGWDSDDHASALKTFQSTCKLIKDDRWDSTCAQALVATNARTFFEERFVPILITDNRDALFTGYY